MRTYMVRTGTSECVYSHELGWGCVSLWGWVGLYTSDVRVMSLGQAGRGGGGEGDVYWGGWVGGLIYLDVSDDGVCVCVCVCVHVCVDARRYVDVGVGGLAQPHAHVDVSVWVSMWVSVWVSMWVSVWMFVSVDVSVGVSVGVWVSV